MTRPRRHARPRSKTLGIRRKNAGWQAYVEIAGKTYSKQFPLATTADVMQRWRQDVIAAGGTPDPHRAGTVGADVEAYLQRRTTMPTYAQRARLLHWWVAQLGAERPTVSLTSHEIAVALDRLQRDGRSAATAKQYRTALAHLFSRQ